MKKLYIPLVILILLGAGIIFNGCYTDAIDSLGTMSVKIPIFFTTEHTSKNVPDTSADLTNLYDYQEYRDNQKSIKKAELLEFNYRIDSLHYGDNIPWVPGAANQPTIQFEFVKFYLQFADSNATGGFDPADMNPSALNDPNKTHFLGSFDTVDVAKYYRSADKIIQVTQTIADVIAEALKNKPQFYIITIYSKATIGGVVQDRYPFPYVIADYDLFIRLKFEL